MKSWDGDKGKENEGDFYKSSRQISVDTISVKILNSDALGHHSYLFSFFVFIVCISVNSYAAINFGR